MANYPRLVAPPYQDALLSSYTERTPALTEMMLQAKSALDRIAPGLRILSQPREPIMKTHRYNLIYIPLTRFLSRLAPDIQKFLAMIRLLLVVLLAGLGIADATNLI